MKKPDMDMKNKQNTETSVLVLINSARIKKNVPGPVKITDPRTGKKL